MITLNKGLREFVIVISCLLVVLCNGCFSYLKEEVLTYKARLDADKELAPPSTTNEVTPSSPQQSTTVEVSPPVVQKTANVSTSDQGKGY